jgi:hypothetical protein
LACDAMSWKIEVQADDTGTWAGNALRFVTEAAAKMYAADLMMRWLAVREKRVVECDDPPKVNDFETFIVTGAPSSYDYPYVVEVGEVETKGGPARIVYVPDEYTDYQIGRYQSGMYFAAKHGTEAAKYAMEVSHGC